MNRAMKRKLAAIAIKKPLPKARADGRPLYYDIGGPDRVKCFFCEKNGLSALYGFKEAFMNDPANSPDGSGDVHTICKHHLPDDAVVYNPSTNTCRDKDGQNEWMEDKPDENASFS